MSAPFRPIPKIASLIASLSAALPPSKDINEFVNLCHKMALAYLRVKLHNRQFDPARLGLSLEDFALDAVADLFAQDSSGRCTTINSFFHRVEERSEEGLHNQLRRLVFSAVNHRIFRTYRELDSSLARILRNIKLSLKNHPAAARYEHQGESMIVPRGEKNLQMEKPFLPPEWIEPELRRRRPPKWTIRDMIEALAGILHEQTTYRKMMPLIEAALLLRKVCFSDDQAVADESSSWPYTEDDVQRLLHVVGRALRQKAEEAYVKKRKLTRAEMEAHILTVEEILRTQFLGTNGESRPLFEVLRGQLITLNQHSYRTKHRVILEYLLKLGRNDLFGRLRKEF
jgi:hypothetical protein